MLLNSLYLKNFRGFAERRFEFKPGINLVIGVNGSGKTALLEACACSIGAFLHGFKETGSRKIKKDDIRLEGNTNGKTTWERKYPVIITAQGSVSDYQGIEWTIERQSSQGTQSNKNATQIINIARGLDNAVRNGGLAILPVLVYYVNGRLWLNQTNAFKDVSDGEKPSRFDGYRNSLGASCTAKSLQNWFITQEWVSFNSGKESDVLEMVKSAILATIDEALKVGYDPELKELSITFNDGRCLPFSYLSDGQREIIALAGDIAVRMMQLNPHLGKDALNNTPGIVLIDEVDLYLHPKWQRDILSKLSKIFPSVQFICTTHSPQIIGEVTPERIIVLDTGNQPAYSFGLDSNTIIEEVMNALPRNKKVYDLINRANVAVAEERFEEAKQILSEVEASLGTRDEEIRRLEAIIRNLEILNSME